MLHIKKPQLNLDNYLINSTDSQLPWFANVPTGVRANLIQARDCQALFGSGRSLAGHIAPPNQLGDPDLAQLKAYLQTEYELFTNDPAIPWELVAWGAVNDRHFWAVDKPVVRVYGDPLPRSDLRVSQWGGNRLVIVSDPKGDLNLLSKHKTRIKDLAQAFPNRIVWNPSREKLIQEVAVGYDLVIFIGHATYDPADPDQSKYCLINDETLTPKDLSINLGAQPVVLFIACLAAQHTPQGDGPAAMPAIGFMPACLNREAAAFIGPLWEIKVDSGLWLAEHFLQHLQVNPPGEALRLARQEALQQTPDDVTWAAFVVYQRPTLPTDTLPPSLVDPKVGQLEMFYKAKVAYQQGYYEEAKRLFDEFQQVFPTALERHVKRG